MDCIHCRLLLRALNCGLNIISRGVGIRIGLIRSVYSLLPPVFFFLLSSSSPCHIHFFLSLCSATIYRSRCYRQLRQIADVQPEWAFANILDQIYEHQSFIKEYLQPLTTKAGYDINVKVSLLYLSSFSFSRELEIEGS
jgi:hypothetical protein